MSDGNGAAFDPVAALLAIGDRLHATDDETGGTRLKCPVADCASDPASLPLVIHNGELHIGCGCAVEAVAAEASKLAKAGDKPAAHRDEDELSDLRLPADILEQAGISEEDLEGIDSAKDLMNLLLGAPESTATQIVKLVEKSGVVLFHDDEQVTYATFQLDGHAETWPLESKAFKQYVRRLYYVEYNNAASGQPVADAFGVLAAKAAFDGPEVPVHYRIAGDKDTIYIDLGDPRWRAVQVTRDGWTVLDHHPVRFRRTGAMEALPAPVKGGNLDSLRGFVNVASDDDWRLVAGWLLAAARPGFPFPVLVAHGEQGSSKSTTAKVLRALIDPNRSPLRVAPHDVDDLMVGARMSWIVAYDNISKIPPALSDALCRISTGGGLSKRQLYTDMDEALIDAMRPVILNGIEEAANRSDLLDRAVIVEMPTISEEDRLPEEVFWKHFETMRPTILGGLCDALVTALDRVGSVKLERLPRMADFAQWVAAAEPALGWEPGSFMKSYAGNRGEVHELAVEGSVLGGVLQAVATDGFEGTAAELLALLAARAGEEATRRKEWPKSARALAGEVARLAPNLRQLGFNVKHWRESSSARRRMVSLGRRSA